MKQVQFSLRRISHSEHRRQLACHSRSGDTLNRNSSMIGCWQPKQILSSEISDPGEVELSVGELEPEPAGRACVEEVKWLHCVCAQCIRLYKNKLRSPQDVGALHHDGGLQKPFSWHSLKCRLTLQGTWEVTTATNQYTNTLMRTWIIPLHTIMKITLNYS